MLIERHLARLTWIRSLALPALGIAALEVYARGPGKTSEALAAPSAAAIAFARALGDGSILQETGFTLASAGAGLVMACIAAVLFGTWLGLSKRAASWGMLTVEVLRPVPSVALIPLAMLVFGFGWRMECAVVAFACFWPLLVLTQAAARQVDKRLLEVAAALELQPAESFRKIVLPSMVPRLFVALRLGVAVALVVAVTVEIGANPHGLGYQLVMAQQSLDPALMLAWLAWVAVVGFAINAGAVTLQRAIARRVGLYG